MKKYIFTAAVCFLFVITGCMPVTRQLRVITDFPEKIKATELFSRVYNASGIEPVYKIGLVNLPTIGIWNLEHHTVLVTKGFFDAGNDKIVMAAFAHELAHELLQHKSKGDIAVKVNTLTDWLSDSTLYKVSGTGWSDLNFINNAVGGYTDIQEMEADQKAIALMKKAGCTKGDYISYLLFLEEKKEMCEKDYLIMHPALEERINILTGASPVLKKTKTGGQMAVTEDMLEASVYEPEDAGPLPPYKYIDRPVMNSAPAATVAIPRAPGDLPEFVKPQMPPEKTAGKSVQSSQKSESTEENGEKADDSAAAVKKGTNFTNEIVSGESALGIKLGVSYDALIAQFGEPDYHKGNMAVYVNDDGDKFIEVFFANTTFNSETIIKNLRVYPCSIGPVVIDGKVSTAKGKQEMLEALGMPEGFRLNEWSYFNKGLHLHFDGAKVDKVQISPPAR